MLEQQVTLDDQLFGETLVYTLVKQARDLMQNIVTDPNRIESNVTGYDDSRFDRFHHQMLDVVETQLFSPTFDPVVFAGCVIVQQRGFKRIQCQRDDCRSAVVFTSLVGGTRENTVLPFLINHALVLDHATFGKNDQLTAMQNLMCQKRKQIRQVIRHHTDGIKELAKSLVAFKKFSRSHRATIGAGCLLYQNLRDEGLEAREMIEQKYITLVHRIVFTTTFLVQLDIEFE